MFVLLPPANVRPQAAHWRAALHTLAIFATALFACTALVCLIAYNWEDLHRFARIALVATAFLVPCALAAVRAKTPPDALQQALYLAAMLAAGGLFALIGQIYQTGADTWQLFALWAALTLPLALIARTRLCWLLWFVLADCALPGALDARFQLWEVEDGRLLLLLLAAFHALAAALFAACGWLARNERTPVRWLLAAAMVLLFFAVPSEDSAYRYGHSVLFGVPALALFYLVMLYLYHRCRHTCRPLAALAAVLVLLHAAIRLADALHDFLDSELFLSLALLAPCALLIFGAVSLRNDLYPAAEKPAPAAPTAEKPAPAAEPPQDGRDPLWLRALQTLLAWVATAFLISASIGLLTALFPRWAWQDDTTPSVLSAALGAFYVWGSLRLHGHPRRFFQQTALPLYLAAHALLYVAVFFFVDDILNIDDILDNAWQISVCAALCAVLAAVLARLSIARSRTFAVLGGSACVLWAHLALFFHAEPSHVSALLPLVLVPVLAWRGLREKAASVGTDALALALAALTLVNLIGGFLAASDIGLHTDTSPWSLAVGTAMLALALVVLARTLAPHDKRPRLGAALCAVTLWVCFCPPHSPAPAGLWLPLATAGLLAAPLLYLAAFAAGRRLWAGIWLALWPPHFVLAYYSSHDVSLLARAAQFSLLALVAGTAWAMNRAATPESTP